MKTNEDKIRDRNEAIEQARWITGGDYYIVDTETTGLKDPQMCQIAIRHSNGQEFKSLIKPTIPIEPGAEGVHHISNADVEGAPDASIVADQIITEYPMVIYNAPFDTKVIANSLAAVGRTATFPEIVDAMAIYAAFHGEWSDYWGSYKWQKLEVACQQCGISMEDVDDGYHEGFHDAMYDVRMTERILQYVANQKLSIE